MTLVIFSKILSVRISKSRTLPRFVAERRGVTNGQMPVPQDSIGGAVLRGKGAQSHVCPTVSPKRKFC